MLDKRALTLPPQLVSRYRTRDPFILAEELGVTVMLRHNFIHQKGAFCVIDRCPFIFINGNLSDQLQRLVCAHELGHALLHRQLAATGGAMLEFRLMDLTSRTEYEANVFAAALLLDDQELRARLESGEDVQSIARAMNVHVDLVLLRLQSSGDAALPRPPASRFLQTSHDDAGCL